MGEAVKVLQVLSVMYPAGAESMAMNLYRRIDRTQVQIDFAVHTKETGAYDAEIEAAGGKIYRVPGYTGKNHLAYIRAWEKLYQEHPEYKIIHAHVRSTAAIFLEMANRYGRITIAHSHSTSEGTGIEAFVKRIMELPLRKVPKYYFACSEKSGQWLFGRNIVNNKNFFVIKNAIDVQKFQYDKTARARIRKELGYEEELVIGHVGRFEKPKNHLFLIQIFCELSKKVKAKLLLAGEGSLYESMHQRCGQLGILNDVTFLGNRLDVPDLMSAMDIFLFPSLYEGLPVTLVEAQASGLPCVVSSHITEEVDFGGLYRVALHEPLQNWVSALLHIDLKKRNRSSAGAVIKDRGFDIAENAKWLQDFYKNISEE